MNAQPSATRIPAYDFVRVAACAGVFCFHADAAVAALFPELQMPHLPDWTGFLFVTVFFMLSGSMLELRYGKKTGLEQSTGSWNITQYYRKRWISIFPAFYIVFIPLYLMAAAKRHSFFYQGVRWTLLLSALGLDGYFSAAFKTYYLIGEWFLGALILLYALYPLLRVLMQKTWPLLLAGSVVLFLLVADWNLLAISPLANLPSCLVSFVCGMFFERFVRRNKNIGVPFFLFTAGLLSFTIALYRTTHTAQNAKGVSVSISVPLHLAGLLLFLFLFGLGSKLFHAHGKKQGNTQAASVLAQIAAFTYTFYLVHHVIIDRSLRLLSMRFIDSADPVPQVWMICAGCAAALVLSIFAAWAVRMLTQLPQRKSGKKYQKKTLS